METILQGLKHVQCYNYIDDILITGSNEKEHLHNLEEVLKRLSQYGITVKEDKCAFLQDKVEYLGHQISLKGYTQPQRKLKLYPSCSYSSKYIGIKILLRTATLLR